jgi:hypothetical protein
MGADLSGDRNPLGILEDLLGKERTNKASMGLLRLIAPGGPLDAEPSTYDRQ